MAIVSRLQLDHPALGTVGGAPLHAQIEALYVKLGNAVQSRWFQITDFDNGESFDLEHNFDTDITNLRYDLYVFTGGQWVLITPTSSPALSAFTFAETVGFEDTKLTVTNVSGGDDLLAAVVIQNDPLYLSQGDVSDIDITTTPPEEGQALVWDDILKKFKPGASGDSSFKVQSVTDPNAVIKGGYLLLDDGRELATYDGSGSASTDFGKDMTIDLDAILGANPANATTYYLYIDINTLGAPVTQTDTGRKVYAVVQANFVLSTTVPDAMNRARYVHRGVIRSATTGTVWSGTGAAFATLASLRHNNGPLAVSPVAYRQAKTVVGAVGSSGQLAGGHHLAVASFPSGLTTNYGFWNLQTNANDGTPNAVNLTNNSSTPFTGTGILGASNDAALFNGSSQYFSSGDSLFNPGNGVSFAFGGWFNMADWTPAGERTLAAIGDATQSYLSIFVETNVIRAHINISAGTHVQTIDIPTDNIADGSWHHIAVSFVGTTLKIWIDGRLAGQAAVSGTWTQPGTTVLNIGRWIGTGQFWAGRASDFFFVKSQALTDEDIRRLAAYKLTHNANVAAENQQWDASVFSATSGIANQDPMSWVVDKSGANDLYFDFLGLTSTDQVAFELSNKGLNAAVVPSKVPFDQTYTSNPSFPLTHGLGAVPDMLEAFGLNASSEWDVLSLTGHVSATATQLTGTLASFFTAGYTSVRLRASVGNSPTGVADATSTSSGLLSASQQDVGGFKRFVAGASFLEGNSAFPSDADLTLTAQSKDIQYFGVTAARTVTLPTGADILLGRTFMIINNTNFLMTVNASNGQALTIANSCKYDGRFAKGYVIVKAGIASPTTPAQWEVVEVYEEFQTTLTFIMSAGVYSQNSTARLVRHNKFAQLSLTSFSQNATATSAIGTSAALPIRFAAAITQRFPCIVNENGAQQFGACAIDNTGGVTLIKDAAGGSFTNGGNAGLSFDQTFNYRTA